MPVIPDAQIAAAALSAGWKGDDAVTAVAVALGESSGRSDARNSIGASGLWQVLQSAHPEFGQQWRDGTWKDPVVNARMGYSVYRTAGNSFRPWVQYTTGAYKLFIPRARKAVGAPGANATLTSADSSSGSSGISGAVDGLTKAASFIVDPHNWLRAAEFVAGVLLIILALVQMTGADKVVKSVAKTAVKAKVIPL